MEAAGTTVDGWAPVVANADLGAQRLTPKPFPPVRETERLQPVAITEPQPGRFIFDLGQNMVGWPRLRIPVAKDGTVTVRFAEMLEAEFAVMHKTRPAHEQAAVTEVTGRVRDKVCIVGDDVTTTGGTLIAGARALREHGAREVWVYVTHALLSHEGLERLAGADDITGIVVTDTVPIDPRERPENLTVLTVAPLLAETIMNVFSDDSVSAIFGGENQLF